MHKMPAAAVMHASSIVGIFKVMEEIGGNAVAML
jgi:hypothetical protein